MVGKGSKGRVVVDSSVVLLVISMVLRNLFGLCLMIVF